MISKVKIYVNGKRKFNWFWKRWCIKDDTILLSDTFKEYCKDKQIIFDYMYAPPNSGIIELHNEEYIGDDE